MADKLTHEQRIAVENRGGKLLVSAAAGSGKTKVLVDRLISYITEKNDPANIDDFLIITYTKAAAAELRGKIAAKLSELIAEGENDRHLQQQMQRLYLAKISTVHSFCTDILRQYAYRLDIPADFRVAEENECLELQVKAIERILELAYSSMEGNPDFCAFIDSQGIGRDDRQVPEIILKVYNSARCHLDPVQWMEQCITAEETGEIRDAGKTIWGKYLMDDLRQYLDQQIESFENCIKASVGVAGLEKPAALLSATAEQLRTLHNCATWDAIVDCREIDYGRLFVSKKCEDLVLGEKMKAIRNACKEGLAKRLRHFSDKSARILQDIEQTGHAAKGLIWLVKGFSLEYDRLKQSRGILDFSDLEHKMLDLLLGKKRCGFTSVAAEIGDRFREIMVDEYQDSNGIQDAIFSALTSKRQNCFMVGDVKQSIYQFRLADPGIFIEKYNTYLPTEEAAHGDGRKVMLSNNFRSSKGVIQAVNDVFVQCMSPSLGGLTYGEAEMLREGIAHIPLNEPEVSLYGIDVESDTYGEEASFVADKISVLLDGTHLIRDGDTLRPIQPEDIVILLRSPGSVGGEFQYALQCRNIRCVTGDSVDLFTTEEIAVVHAILQIIQNPLQDIPLVTVLTSPVFCYSADDLAKLKSKDRHAGIFELLNNESNEKNTAFLQILKKLRQDAKILTVSQLLSEIYTQTNILNVFGAKIDGENRLDNLQTFFQIVSDYENSGPKELGRLLDYLESIRERGLGLGGEVQETGAVTIMSIHKSKGLEFPVVFLCGLSRRFNQESLRSQILCDKDLGLGLSCVDIKQRVRYPSLVKRAISTKMLRESISEELRVLYVAMTRARDRLIMTYAAKNFVGVLQELSGRIDMSSKTLLPMEAGCPGDWVLQTALTRTEAGAFFKLGGPVDCAKVSDLPWNIEVASGSSDYCVKAENIDKKVELSPNVLASIKDGMAFTYSHGGATQIPSKLTATQLKGRVLDDEVKEGSSSTKTAEFRKPGSGIKSGKSYGNAIHVALQYIDYSACKDLTSIQEEISRLAHENLISPEQALMVDAQKLASFFATTIGQKIRTYPYVLREFKFSLLDDAAKYYPDADGEKVLLQGVVDCAIIEKDGITVLDFKTDYITNENFADVVKRYRPQVLAYSDALERIYQMPVKSAKLYFFSINEFVDVL